MFYLTCVESGGNACRTNLDPISDLQKRAIRTIKDVGYIDSTDYLLIGSHALKFQVTVYLKNMMFQVVSKFM